MFERNKGDKTAPEVFFQSFSAAPIHTVIPKLLHISLSHLKDIFSRRKNVYITQQSVGSRVE